jgi:hypothetical protein
MYLNREDITLHRKLLQNLTIATLTLGGIAEAGNVTTGQDLSGVSVINNNMLSCAEVTCSGGRQRQFTLIDVSAGFTRSNVSASTFTSDFQTVVNTSLDMQRLSSMPGLAVADAVSPKPSSSETASEGDNFILTGTEIIEIPSVPASSAPAPQVKYTDPIVSPAFNSLSTVIVVTGQLPASQSKTNKSSSDIDTLSSPSPATASAPAAAPVTAKFTSPMSFAVEPMMIASTTPMMSMVGPSTDTPEPATDLLIGAGLVAAGVFARVKRQSNL